MINLAEKNICTGCSSCASACPRECISMLPDSEGFLYPKVNNDKCTECGICRIACPVLGKNTPHTDVAAYAVQNTDNNIRLQSSSGGFFSLLAEYILDQNGAVFGAALDKNLNVCHICVDNKDDIEKLRGSKYVQSVIGNTYSQAKKLLNNGITVLFTGTPCQIEGLLKFLGKSYDNLITQDIICHGVPSPTVWKKHIEWHENKTGSTVVKASFRNKKNGWKAFSMHLQFENGEERFYQLNDDLFLKSFLSDLCLRPSCHNCSFKEKFRPSDFTLADFWGVHNIIPDIDDDKGTSLVMVNSKKSAEIFKKLQPFTNYYAVDTDKALKYNTAATQSVREPISRKAFIEEIQATDIDTAIKKYCPQKNKPLSFPKRILRKIKKIIKP